MLIPEVETLSHGTFSNTLSTLDLLLFLAKGKQGIERPFIFSNNHVHTTKFKHIFRISYVKRKESKIQTNKKERECG